MNRTLSKCSQRMTRVMLTTVIFQLITNTIVNELSDDRLSNILEKSDFDIHNVAEVYILGTNQSPIDWPNRVSSLHLTHERRVYRLCRTFVRSTKDIYLNSSSKHGIDVYLSFRITVIDDIKESITCHGVFQLTSKSEPSLQSLTFGEI